MIDEVEQQVTNVMYLVSDVPTPSIVHVCREARRFTKYQKAFSNIWINFDYDMISISVQDDWRPGSEECYLQDRASVQRIQLRIHRPGQFCGWAGAHRPNSPMLKELQSIRSDGLMETYFYRPDRYHWILYIVTLDNHTISTDSSSGVVVLGDWPSTLSDRPYAQCLGSRWQEAVGSNLNIWGESDVDGDIWGEITNSEQFRKKWEETVPPAERHVTRLQMPSKTHFISELDAAGL
jgi:hypothetical protein